MHVNTFDALIFNNSIDAIVLHNKGSIVKANEAFQELFDYNIQDLDSFHLLELINFEFRNLVFERIQKINNKAYFVTAKNRSGDRLHLEFCDIAISKSLTCTIIRDLTPLKEMEQEIRELRQQTLHNQKLASVATVLSSFIHELNTPLTAICSFTEILASKKTENDLPLKILKASLNMKKMIEQIRQYSRDGKYEQLKHVSIQSVIENAATLLSHRLQKLSININIESAQKNAIIWGNENQLQSIIQNFISNSCDSFEDVDDDRNKTISIYVATSSNNNCIIKYSDNANGMSDNIIKQIFKPFFTTKDKTKGTGLGMSITKTIVEKHKGIITVSSTEGIGTTFQLVFPSINKTSFSKPTNDTVHLPNTKPKVLIIDDQIEIVEILTFFLEDYFQVTGYQNPHHALDKIVCNNFDLIITDLEMPDISGLDVIDFAKANSAQSMLVVISGHGQTGPESYQARKRGADLVLSKPFEGRKEFLKHISNLFDKSKTDFRLNL